MSKGYSQELFELIKSLNKSEKRHFKLFSALYVSGKTNNYIRLFDSIDRQHQINDKAIKQQQKLVNNYSRTKNYLYELIIKSLDNYHSQKNPNIMLNNELNKIEILSGKGLYSQCEKVIGKLEKSAYKQEKYPIILQLIDWKKVLIFESFSGNTINEELVKHYVEEENAIGRMKVYSELKKISDKLHIVYQTKGPVRKNQELAALKKLIDNPVFAEKEFLSPRVEIAFNAAHAMHNNLIGDYEGMYQCYNNNFNIYKQNNSLVKSSFNEYLSTINNLMYSQYFLEKYAELKKTLLYFKTVGSETISSDTRIFISSSNMELLLCQKTGEFSEGFYKIQEIVKTLEKFGEKVDKASVIKIYFSIAYVCFGSENYNKALGWINKIFPYQSLNIAEDTFTYAKILEMLIHFELENEQLIDYINLSTYRYAVKRNRLYKFEEALLIFFKKNQTSFTGKANIKKFQTLKEELLTIFKDPNEKKILSYFDIISWVQGKIEGKPFAEVVKINCMQSKKV